MVESLCTILAASLIVAAVPLAVLLGILATMATLAVAGVGVLVAVERVLAALEVGAALAGRAVERRRLRAGRRQPHASA